MARGSFARGGHHETNGHHRPKSTQPTEPAPAKRSDDVVVVSDTEASVVPATVSSTAPDTTDILVPEKEPVPVVPSTNARTSTPSVWASDTAPVANGSASPAALHTIAAKVVKTPATSKLSWAQIARCVKRYIDIASISLTN